jgi:hypothetical protein
VRKNKKKVSQKEQYYNKQQYIGVSQKVSLAGVIRISGSFLWLRNSPILCIRSFEFQI